MLPQCYKWKRAHRWKFTWKQRIIIATSSFKRDKVEEKASAIGKKIYSYSEAYVSLVTFTWKISNACGRVCLDTEKKQPNRTKILDNPIYKQKIAQLSLLQRNNPTDFESKEATEQETNKN